MLETIGKFIQFCNEENQKKLKNSIFMAIFWSGRVLFHALSTSTSHRATFAVLGEMRKRCIEKLAHMPLGVVLDRGTGSLKNILIERYEIRKWI